MPNSSSLHKKHVKIPGSKRRISDLSSTSPYNSAGLAYKGNLSRSQTAKARSSRIPSIEQTNKREIPRVNTSPPLLKLLRRIVSQNDMLRKDINTLKNTQMRMEQNEIDREKRNAEVQARGPVHELLMGSPTPAEQALVSLLPECENIVPGIGNHIRRLVGRNRLHLAGRSIALDYNPDDGLVLVRDLIGERRRINSMRSDRVRKPPKPRHIILWITKHQIELRNFIARVTGKAFIDSDICQVECKSSIETPISPGNFISNNNEDLYSETSKQILAMSNDLDKLTCKVDSLSTMMHSLKEQHKQTSGDGDVQKKTLQSTLDHLVSTVNQQRSEINKFIKSNSDKKEVYNEEYRDREKALSDNNSRLQNNMNNLIDALSRSDVTKLTGSSQTIVSTANEFEMKKMHASLKVLQKDMTSVKDHFTAISTKTNKIGNENIYSALEDLKNEIKEIKKTNDTQKLRNETQLREMQNTLQALHKCISERKDIQNSTLLTEQEMRIENQNTQSASSTNIPILKTGEQIKEILEDCLEKTITSMRVEEKIHYQKLDETLRVTNEKVENISRSLISSSIEGKQVEPTSNSNENLAKETSDNVKSYRKKMSARHNEVTTMLNMILKALKLLSEHRGGDMHLLSGHRGGDMHLSEVDPHGHSDSLKRVLKMLKGIQKATSINHKHMNLIYHRKGEGVCSRIFESIQKLHHKVEGFKGEIEKQHTQLLEGIDNQAYTNTSTDQSKRSNEISEINSLKKALRKLRLQAAIDSGKHAVYRSKTIELEKTTIKLLKLEDQLVEAYTQIDSLAATKLQATQRGNAIRKRSIEKEKEVKYVTENKVASTKADGSKTEHTLSLKDVPTVEISNGHHSIVANESPETLAAIKIQACHRGRTTRKTIVSNKIISEAAAATKIQARQRGMNVRKKERTKVKPKAKFVVGETVAARYIDSPNYYEAIIKDVVQNNEIFSYTLLFSDGDFQKGITESNIKSLRGLIDNKHSSIHYKAETPDSPNTFDRSTVEYCIGQSVAARYNGGEEYFEGIIIKMNDNFTFFDVKYSDGEIEKDIPRDFLDANFKLVE